MKALVDGGEQEHVVALGVKSSLPPPSGQVRLAAPQAAINVADFDQPNRPSVCVLSDDGAAGSALAQRIDAWGLPVRLATGASLDEFDATTFDVFVVATPCSDAVRRRARQAAARPPHPYVLVLGNAPSSPTRTRAKRHGAGRASVKHVAPEALEASLFELVVCAIPLRRLASRVAGRLSLKDVQKHVRTALLLEAFARADGSRRLAARILGVTRPAVQQMLATLDLAENAEDE